LVDAEDYGMAWIESHQELGRHPKTKHLARTLKISVPAAVGHLMFLWWWALDFAQDGDLSAFTVDDIADAAGWDGDPQDILDAFISNGFIDKSESQIQIHDWNEYAGRLIEKREKNNERAKRNYNAKKLAMGEEENADINNSSQILREENKIHCEEKKHKREFFDATVPNSTVPKEKKEKETRAREPLRPADESKISRFIPPSLEEVSAYCQERKNRVDPERFIDFYASKGWLIGKAKMKDWMAAVRTWEKNGKERDGPNAVDTGDHRVYRDEWHID
jgi:hypothetical protein